MLKGIISLLKVQEHVNLSTRTSSSIRDVIREGRGWRGY